MLRFALALAFVVACHTEEPQPAPIDASVMDARRVQAPDAVIDAPVVVEQGYVRPSFCDRPTKDAVRDVFCGDTAPAIRGIRDLYRQLGVSPAIAAPALDAGTYAGDAGYGIDPNTIIDNALFLSHSTSLSGHLVSPINPRAIIFGKSSLLTYQRGVQQVEIASFARDEGTFNFFLVQFEQACNSAPGGCKPGDLYTPRVESDWLRVSVRDGEDLANTSFDCKQCHQRGREAPMLLMRELESPWTHFFELDQPDYVPGSLPGVRGLDLVRDYREAKGGESYAGVAAFTLEHTFGVVLQNLVNRDQPLLFDAPKIEEERWPFDEASGTYASSPRRSATWDAAFAAFQRGEQLALPHFEPRPTDPEKQARLTAAYQRYRAGELPADELPDLADIFPDDPAVRAEIGLQTTPGASAPEALVQACGTCHNDVLDQGLSRARFNIDLARMSRAELDVAIERIERTTQSAGVMPPPEARQLDSAARAALIAYLRANQRSSEDDALLSHAAQVGFTGGSKP